MPAFNLGLAPVQYLRRLGYHRGPLQADQKGAKITEALKAFQRDYGLAITGRFDNLTVKKLQDEAEADNALSLMYQYEIGIGVTPRTSAGGEHVRLDVLDRVRVRQGETWSAGIWLHQRNTGKDEAFVGMKSDTEVGFWGVELHDWGCWMNTASGDWHTPKTLHAAKVLSAEMVGGEVYVLGGDCAERLETTTQADPGTLMILNPAGLLEQSTRSYDKRVAGVVSGAGDLKPGLMLNSQSDAADTLPIALCGKVFCKVEADSNPIEVGDLLTTSDVPGHAMKAVDCSRAFGSVLGKATRSLASGRGLIPILVTLQ